MFANVRNTTRTSLRVCSQRSWEEDGPTLTVNVNGPASLTLISSKLRAATCLVDIRR